MLLIKTYIVKVKNWINNANIMKKKWGQRHAKAGTCKNTSNKQIKYKQSSKKVRHREKTDKPGTGTIGKDPGNKKNRQTRHKDSSRKHKTKPSSSKSSK